MPTNDLPKIWIDEEEKFNPETGEIYDNTSALLPTELPEEPPLPSIEEQKAAITSATDIKDDSRNMLAALVEMNSVAETLSKIRSTETAEQRKTVITAWCEGFINSRMRNNVVAETLKSKLLERLLDNVENLDLETASRIYNDLTEVSAVDAQQAMSNVVGGSAALPGQGSGISLTINNATSEGATITNNTLNANPQQITQLKETATLNASLKAWSNVPLPKKKEVIDTEYNEEK